MSSIDVETCKVCARLSKAAADAIECTPPPNQPAPADLRDVARLGANACVGDAMGLDAVALDASLTAEVSRVCLTEAGAVMALVVDAEGHLVGLLDASEVSEAPGGSHAHQLARWVTPILESAPLAEAVLRMVHERSRALPVEGHEGMVVGVITDLDALRWVARRDQGP